MPAIRHALMPRASLARLAVLALLWGSSFLWIKVGLRGFSPVQLVLIRLSLGFAILLPIVLMQPITWRADAVLSVVVLGVFGTGVAYVLNYRLIADEGPATASITTYLLPVVAVALGYLVLAEPVTMLMMLGISLVLLGVYLAQRSRAA
jgi:drug/metabolite transporter (DMT)-like permease